MVEIKGHRHRGGGRIVPWPRKQLPEHTEGNCPYCSKKVKNVEAHVKRMHKGEKLLKIRGKKHGHPDIQ